MYANNLFCHDPTHIFSAKYFTKQTIVQGSNSKEYIWNDFITFKCKPIMPRASRYTTTNSGYQRTAPDTVFLETKWAGIHYSVGDYVEYMDVKYQIKEVKKDETKVNMQVLLLMGNNPNTYYIIELSEVNNLDLQKGEENNVK